MTNVLQDDLHARWLPSPEQMRMADALLAAGYDKDRGQERGVYTAHVLVNKRFSFWTLDVQLEFADGVFLTREGAQRAAYFAAEAAHARTDLPCVGGYAWHSRVGEAAVWDDILAQFPSTRSRT